MSPLKLSTSIRLILETLGPTHKISMEQIAELWGPITSLQRDSYGQVIQKYLSILVRETTGRWILVRQINRVENGHEWTSRPMAQQITEESSRDWLMQNNLYKEGV